MDLESTPASEVYELRLTDNEEKPKRFLRWFTVIIANIISIGQGPTSTGGRMIEVVEKATGTVVHSFKEDMGDESGTSVEYIRNELDTLSAEAFAKRWWKRRGDA